MAAYGTPISRAAPSISADVRDDANSPAKPLIIIIDELDRCRPSFALQILERIKHFFAVPHVHFVLGAHLSQLENSVKVEYGSGINAHLYLQKFIQLTLHLVDGALHPHQRTNKRFIGYLLDAMEFPADKMREYGEDYFLFVSQRRDMSLRTIERLMSTLAIAVTYKPNNIYCPIPAVLGLCVLKVMDPNLYAKAKAGTVELDEVKDPLGLLGTIQGEQKYIVELMSEYWEFCLASNDRHELAAKYGAGLSPAHLERHQVLPHVANNVLDRLQV